MSRWMEKGRATVDINYVSTNTEVLKATRRGGAYSLSGMLAFPLDFVIYFKISQTDPIIFPSLLSVAFVSAQVYFVHVHEWARA